MDYEDISTEGITKITADDIKYAKAMGMVIKLLATSKKTEEGYYAMVAPFLLSPQHPLYSVNDVFNAIFVHGNVLGDAMFYGSGAGKLPTASAVVADIVDIAKHLHKNILISWSSRKMDLVDKGKAESRFFVRTTEGQMQAKEVFGEVELIQVPGIDGEIGFLTGIMTEEAFEEKAAKIHVIQRIRVV